MSKHKILVKGNHGGVGRLPEKCIKFIESKGKKYPDILGCRHDPVLIEMFEKFAEEEKVYNVSRKILYCQPLDGMGNYRGYYMLNEIEGDVYCIDDYDGVESALTPYDFDWIHIKD